MVRIQSVRERLGKEGIDVDTSIVQTPDLDRIEPEVGLGITAVRIGIVAVPRAVGSQVDRVMVFHAQVLFCGFEGATKEGCV